MTQLNVGIADDNEKMVQLLGRSEERRVGKEC